SRSFYLQVLSECVAVDGLVGKTLRESFMRHVIQRDDTQSCTEIKFVVEVGTVRKIPLVLRTFRLNGFFLYNIRVDRRIEVCEILIGWITGIYYRSLADDVVVVCKFGNGVEHIATAAELVRCATVSLLNKIIDQ